MSKTPLNVITAQLPTLITVSTNIETDADIALDSYEGSPVLLDVESHLSPIANPNHVNIIIELVKLIYPKWNIEFYTNTNTVPHRFLKFTAKDFS